MDGYYCTDNACNEQYPVSGFQSERPTYRNEGLTGLPSYLRPANDRALACYLYQPTVIHSARRVLVAVHGISRNAREQSKLYQPLADRLGLRLIAPLFDDVRFKDYQSLGFKGLHRADLAFRQLIDRLSSIFGQQGLSIHLLGYSGGAQFAHRLAMLNSDLDSLHICSPGWYSFPTTAHSYPLGTGRNMDAGPGFQLQPERLLRVPTQVLVGELDRARSDNLNCKRAIDKLQGNNRLQRGLRWYQGMAEFAEKRGLQWDAELQIMPRQRHDFSACILDGRMDLLIGSFIERRIERRRFGESENARVEIERECRNLL